MIQSWSVAVLLFALGSVELAAQTECPDRGVKNVAAVEIASDAGASCGQGISFTFGGITYTPNDDKCPAWLEYTPSHKEPDQQTVKAGTRWDFDGTYYDITKQLYHCTGAGCGILWLEGCCEPNGPPTVVNSMPNYIEIPCTPDP